MSIHEEIPNWPIVLENPGITDVHYRDRFFEDKVFVYRKGGLFFGLLTKDKILTEDIYLDAFRLILGGKYQTCIAWRGVGVADKHHNDCVLICLLTGKELVSGFSACRYIDGKYFSFRVDSEGENLWGIYDMEMREMVEDAIFPYPDFIRALEILK